MPSPPSTAMWKALLADMKYLGAAGKSSLRGAKRRSNPRLICGSMDCFASLAMTGLRRQHGAADQLALVQVVQRVVGFRQRQRRHRDRRDLLRTHEVEQFLCFAKIADIAALDRHGLDRDQRQRERGAATEQADDDQLAALGQAIESELRGLCAADEINHGADRPA